MIDNRQNLQRELTIGIYKRGATMKIRTNRYVNIWKWLVVIIFLLGIAGPVFLLFGKSVLLLFSKASQEIPFISISLFAKSVGISLAASTLSCVLGVLCAIFVWTSSPKYYKKIFLAILLCALIPPFIHVHSWIKVMDGVCLLFNSILGTNLNFTGVFAVIFTTAFSYLPYTISLCLMGLFSIPMDINDLIRTEDAPLTLFKKCISPYFLPYLFIGGIFVFLITINDFSIASAFNINVFALELFSLYSASGDIYSIALSSLPLILLSILLLAGLWYLSDRYEVLGDIDTNKNPLEKEKFMKCISFFGGITISLYILIPLLTMVVESFTTRKFISILIESVSEISYSLIVSMGTSVIVVFFSVLIYFFWQNKRHRSILYFILSFSFLIPSAILGLGLISFWNQSFLSQIYQSPYMPVIGLATRFLILSLLFLTVRINRLDKGLIDATVLSYSYFKGLFCVIIPMIWKDILACMLLIFALSMSEYGIVLLVTPPGYQMLTIKIYNYLHYGATEVVYALNLFVFLIIMIIALLIFALYSINDNDETKRRMKKIE